MEANKEGYLMEHNTLGHRIKHHRKRLGLTQEQLAERMGVSPQAVSKWENNLSCPDIAALPQLAEVFGITVDELLGKTACTAEVIDEPRSEGRFQWHWDGGRYYSILTAIFVLLFGGLWLVNVWLNTGVSWWTLLWTLSLIYGGACGLRNHLPVLSVALMLTGSYFLLQDYGFLTLQLGWELVAPVCILACGLSLLIDACRKKKKRRSRFAMVNGSKEPRCECICTEGTLHCEMAFGDYRTTVETDCLCKGSIEGAFGDFTVDFSGVQSVAPGCSLMVECSFGDMTLLVPAHYAVQLGNTEQFAGEVQVQGAPADVTRGTITIAAADASFGAIQIRYI